MADLLNSLQNSLIKVLTPNVIETGSPSNTLIIVNLSILGVKYFKPPDDEQNIIYTYSKYNDKPTGFYEDKQNEKEGTLILLESDCIKLKNLFSTFSPTLKGKKILIAERVGTINTDMFLFRVFTNVLIISESEPIREIGTQYEKELKVHCLDEPFKLQISRIK